MAFDMKMALVRPALKYALERNGHGAALGFTLDRVERGETHLTFPYREDLVGNPITGVVHGGTIVTLLYCVRLLSHDGTKEAVGYSDYGSAVGLYASSSAP